MYTCLHKCGHTCLQTCMWRLGVDAGTPPQLLIVLLSDRVFQSKLELTCMTSLIQSFCSVSIFPGWSYRRMATPLGISTGSGDLHSGPPAWAANTVSRAISLSLNLVLAQDTQCKEEKQSVFIFVAVLVQQHSLTWTHRR